jgi:nitronate monooxygenase
MYAIMQAGANAVKLGTRFVTTHECDASLAFKESYIACEESELAIINSPVGLPGRVIKNDFVEQIMLGNTKPFKCAWHCLSSCDFRTAPYCIAQALHNAAQGRMDEGFAFAGSNAYKAGKIQYVSEVMTELVTEYNMESARSNQTISTEESPQQFIRAVA